MVTNPNLNELVTTTLRNRTGKLADNVTRNNALLNHLMQKGNAKPFTGGRTLVKELDWANNQTGMWYSGYETLNIAPSTVISAAEFEIKQAAVAVSMSGFEQLQNSGPEQSIDWLAGRIKNAERTMANLIALAVYSDGTGDGGKQMGGLQLLVAANPTTGTVGGINRATTSNGFWRNQYYRAITDGGAAVSSANIQGYMNTLYYRCTRGADKPDIIVADNTMYGAYEQSLQAIQRITSEKSASAGFSALAYKDTPVMLDGGFQGSSGDPSGLATGGAPSGTLYMLNSEYIFYQPHRDRNMVPLNPDRFAVNQDAMVKLIAFAGNMTLSNAFLQGVLTNT